MSATRLAFEVYKAPFGGGRTLDDMTSAVSYALSLSEGSPLQAVGFGGGLNFGTQLAADASFGLRLMAEVCEGGLEVTTNTGLVGNVETRLDASVVTALVDLETDDQTGTPRREPATAYVWNLVQDNAVNVQNAIVELEQFIRRESTHGATVIANPMELVFPVLA